MASLNEDKKINLQNLPDEKLVRNLDDEDKRGSRKIILLGVVILALGILSGFILSKITSNKTTSGGISGINNISSKAVGSTDTKTFPDSTEGQLEAGGINGEGTHKLIRPGGDSQTVYLTSSVLDLNQFVGKKVKVWGQTFSAQKAGWLMDVGRIEVL